ncbi:MAG: c-type cytochrome [Chitinophagales bacterium]|nr:c-type cytochrome [Chitinophagales bacterium]MDW8419001.1 cbb3-type cytochrome c oxidase N-terminal domain-containing protein [Chitinophagales bacterium]
MNRNIIKAICVLASVMMAVVAYAQQAENVGEQTFSRNDILIYVIMASSVVLLIAIYLLGKVYVSLVKLKLEKGALKTIALLIMLLAATGVSAQTQQTSSHYPIIWDVSAGIFVLFIEFITLIWLTLSIRKTLREISPEPATEPVKFTLTLPRLFDNLNASVAVEKEADILFDHNYDGIRELDNQLPPWWKYSFYISIIWGIAYMVYYHLGNGPSSKEEYEKEVYLAQIQIEEYNRKNANQVDENNITLANSAGVLEGAEIYKANCAACHGGQGEGGVGPNLTDKYWLHGGSLSDIFKSVKYGWPAKGMKAWQADLTPLQMKNVVSYIYSLQGTNPPNAKQPEGIEYMPVQANSTTDSTAVANK